MGVKFRPFVFRTLYRELGLHRVRNIFPWYLEHGYRRGKEIKTMNATPGAVVEGVLTRQSESKDDKD
jgi:hypothetical protein